MRHREGVTSAGAAKSLAWSAMSLLGSKLLAFASTLILARLLVPEQFGVVAAGLTIIAVLETGLDLGVGAAVVYEQEQGLSDRMRTAFTLNVLVAAFFTVAAISAAPLVADFFGVPDDVDLLRVLFLHLLVRGLSQVPDAVLKRDLRFQRRAVVEITKAVVRASVSISLAYSGWGAWSLVIGLMCGEVIGTILTFVAIRFVPWMRIDRSAVATLLRYGGAVLAIRMLSAIGENSGYLVVGNVLGATELGVYLLAVRVPELFLANMYWIISSVAFSLYARVGTANPEAFGSAVLRALRLVTLPAFTVAVGIAIVSEDLTMVLLPEAWAGAAAPMALVALAMGVSAIGYASGDVFPAIGRPGVLAKVLVPIVAVRVTALLIAAPYGLTAVAAVYLAVSVLNALVRLLLIRRFIGISVPKALSATAPALLACVGVVLAAGTCVMLMEPGATRLAVSVAAGVAGAFVAVYLCARDVLPEVWSLVSSVVRKEGVKQ